MDQSGNPWMVPADIPGDELLRGILKSARVMAEHDAIQAQFQELTGADAQTARFYLESSGWKLDAATATFFDNPAGPTSPPTLAAAAKPPPPVAQMNHQPAHANPAAPASGGLPASAPSKRPAPLGSRGGSGGGPRMKSLSDMKGGDSDSDDDGHGHGGEKEQSYYAGGASSGQVVKAGRKPSASPADVVKEVFDSAKSHGAEVVDPHEGQGKEEKKAFEGAGFRLGTSLTPSMPDPSTVKKPAGFSIDDGPLRKFDDPANKAFLQDIHGGTIPRELQAKASAANAQLNVNLVDKSHEDYAPPKVLAKPFAGSGNKLGTTAAPAAAHSAQHSPAPPPVDASQPSTTLQIRLADGTRMVAKFNVTASIVQVRQFIDAARAGSKNYSLQTPMPVVVLNDTSKTLKELGLLNATVIQKMT